MKRPGDAGTFRSLRAAIHGSGFHVFIPTVGRIDRKRICTQSAVIWCGMRFRCARTCRESLARRWALAEGA
jgi:hypothetical protein